MVAHAYSPTPETEAGESLEPGGKGCSEPRSRHCTPAWVTEQDSISKKKRKRYNWGWTWWLTPVIPALWEAKASGSSEVRSSRPSWQHGENPSLIKIQKCRLVTVAYAYNPSTLRGPCRQIAGAQEFKANLGNMAKPCPDQNKQTNKI